MCIVHMYIGTTSVKENYFCVWPDRQLFYLTRLVSVSESFALRFDEGLDPFRKSCTKACHIIILIYVELALANIFAKRVTLCLTFFFTLNGRLLKKPLTHATAVSCNRTSGKSGGCHFASSPTKAINLL